MSGQGILTLVPSPEPLAEVIALDEHRSRRHGELVAEARRLMTAGRDDEALACCREALRLVPDSEQALALASTLALVTGDTREGLRFALELVQLDPEEADGYYEVALSLLDLAHPDEALAWLEMGSRYLEGRGEEADLHDFYAAAAAEALALLQRYEEAAAILDEAVESRGDDLGLIEDARARVRQLEQRPRC